MDTSLPPGDKSGTKAVEPMEADAESKPRPSTPGTRNSPGAVLEKTLSLPSQPEFSHDVLVAATQSLAPVSISIGVAPQDTRRKPVTLPVESSPSTVNTESNGVASEKPEDDSQAAQKEGLVEEPKVLRVAPDGLSQADREGPEAKGVKDESLSDRSGEHHRETHAGQMASKNHSTLSEEQRELNLGHGLLGDARMQPVVKLYRIDFLLVQEEPPQIKEEQDDGFSYIGHDLFSSSTQEVEEQLRQRVMAIFDEKSDEEDFLGFPDPDHDSKPSKQTHSIGRQSVKKNCICTECGKRFRDKGMLNAHTVIHTGKWPCTCKICGKGCMGKGDLAIHMRTHTGLKPFTCTVCYKAFRQIAHVKSHMRTHTGERPVTCTICGKGCAHNGQLKQHMMSHTGEKPFICTYCGKGFSYVSHLKTHWMTHTEERPFTCEVCGMSFRQKINLKKHMMTHTGERRPRPFVCTLCGQGFEARSKLKIHTMTHTGEKPLKCNVCGYACREKGYLATHMRTHTGEKPFICKVCGKGCRQSSHLRTHELIHSGEKPFQCKLCDKRFCRPGDVKMHQRVHTGEYPYQCKNCEKRFTRSNYLKKHQENDCHTVTNVSVS